jgi:polyhydroxybutyrate depolymerase
MGLILGRFFREPLLTCFAASIIACGSSSSSPSQSADASAPDSGSDASTDAAVDASAPDADASFDPGAIVAARPYKTHVPTSYDATKPTPLVVGFHGYGASAIVGEAIVRLVPTSDAHGFLYAYPDGLTDSTGSQFWNATDACCNIDHNSVDDVRYFDAIVLDMSAKYNVDPKRIFVVGHSNGAFMAHRLACDRAHTVAAIGSLAGATFLDASKCNPSEKVSVVEIHADTDMTVLYGGGTSTSTGIDYPSAHATVATWASKNGCTGALAATGTTYDFDTSVAGNETKVEAYGGCPTGIDVQLFTMQGGSHIPPLNRPTFEETLWSFLSAHAKP